LSTPLLLHLLHQDGISHGQALCPPAKCNPLRTALLFDTCADISAGERRGRAAAAHEDVHTQFRPLPSRSNFVMLTGQPMKCAASPVAGVLLRHLSPIHLSVLCRVQLNLQVLQATGTPMVTRSPQQGKRLCTVHLPQSLGTFVQCTTCKLFQHWHERLCCLTC